VLRRALSGNARGTLMTAPKALIADNEPLLRAQFRERLSALWPDLDICAEAANGTEALRALRRFQPDVLFLDVQMPGSDGLDVALQAGGKAHVVFVSAYDTYAMAAFERGAVDYIQKPFSTARLATAIARVRERLTTAPRDFGAMVQWPHMPCAQPDAYLKWLTVPHGRDFRFLSTDEICYLRADNKYATLVTADAEYLLTSSLKQMREKLDPRAFWQIHRGILVNVATIRSVHRSSHGALDVRLKNRPEALPVSAAHVALFKHL
jgi:DNA-binding LytR/AlgR family response regulator